MASPAIGYQYPDPFTTDEHIRIPEAIITKSKNLLAIPSAATIASTVEVSIAGGQLTSPIVIPSNYTNSVSISISNPEIILACTYYFQLPGMTTIFEAFGGTQIDAAIGSRYIPGYYPPIRQPNNSNNQVQVGDTFAVLVENPSFQQVIIVPGNGGSIMGDQTNVYIFSPISTTTQCVMVSDSGCFYIMFQILSLPDAGSCGTYGMNILNGANFVPTPPVPPPPASGVTLLGDYDSTTGGVSSIITLYADQVDANCGSTVGFRNSTSQSTLNVTDSDTSGNTVIGLDAGTNMYIYVGDAYMNTALGFQSLVGSSTFGMTGYQNVAIGANSLMYDTSADDNSGYQNVAVGANSLMYDSSGNNNVGVGYAAVFGAGMGSGTGNYNTGIGSTALTNLTSGSLNTAVGYQSMAGTSFAVTGTSNTSVGASSLYSISTALDNVAVGYQAMAGFGIYSEPTTITGNYNTSIGTSSLQNITSGSNNVAIGWSAMSGYGTPPNLLDGSNNVAIGYQSMNNATSASYNVAIGNSSGSAYSTNEQYNICIGAGVEGAATESGVTRIGSPTNINSCYIAGIAGQTVTNPLNVVIDSSGQLGTITTPDTISLYVNGATGSDVTGTGSSGSPYQTIDRAMQQVRSTGWNTSASITVQSSNPTLTLPYGYINVDSGSLGQQINPLVIQGATRTQIGGTYTITGVTIDTITDPSGNVEGSYLVTLEVSSASFAATLLGQIVHFQTGNLSQYDSSAEYGGAACPTQQVEAFIGNIPTSTSIQITWASKDTATTPAIGDEFIILSTTTSILVPSNSTNNLSPIFYSGGSSIVLYNINFVNSASSDATLQINGAGVFYLNCVTLTAAESSTLNFVCGTSVQASTTQNTFSMQGSSTAGLCLIANAEDDCTIYMSTLANPGIPPIGTSLVSCGGTLALGFVIFEGNMSFVNLLCNGRNGNDQGGPTLTLTGICTLLQVLAINLKSLTTSYYGPFLTISGPTNLSYANIQPYNGALQVSGTGNLAAHNILILAQAGTTASGIFVNGGGVISVAYGMFTGEGSVNPDYPQYGIEVSAGYAHVSYSFLSGWSDSGILINVGSFVQINGVSCTGLTNGLTISGATVNLSNMTIELSPAATGNGLNCTNSFLTILGMTISGWDVGMYALGCTFTATGTSSFSQCAANAIYLDGSVGTIQSGTFTGPSGTQDGIVVINGSQLKMYGSVSITDYGGNGISVQRSSTLFLGGTATSGVTISGNNASGIYLSGNSNGYLSYVVGISNNVYGVQLANGSSIAVDTNTSVTGTGGNCKIGNNGVTTWGTIATQALTVVSDYSSSTTQMCRATVGN